MKISDVVNDYWAETRMSSKVYVCVVHTLSFLPLIFLFFFIFLYFHIFYFNISFAIASTY